MSTGTLLEELTAWWQSTALAMLDLPTFPFGQPGDLHQLTNATAWNDRLLIELDGQIVLVILRPSGHSASPVEFRIDRFDQLVFDWEEYGSHRPHADVLPAGSLRFVALPEPPRMRPSAEGAFGGDATG